MLGEQLKGEVCIFWGTGQTHHAKEKYCLQTLLHHWSVKQEVMIMIGWVSWCQATPNKQSNDESFTEPFTVFTLFGEINLLCERPTVPYTCFFTVLWDKRKYFII